MIKSRISYFLCWSYCSFTDLNEFGMKQKHSKDYFKCKLFISNFQNPFAFRVGNRFYFIYKDTAYVEKISKIFAFLERFVLWSIESTENKLNHMANIQMKCVYAKTFLCISLQTEYYCSLKCDFQFLLFHFFLWINKSLCDYLILFFLRDKLFLSYFRFNFTKHIENAKYQL